jgi:hypothetical protein
MNPPLLEIFKVISLTITPIAVAIIAYYQNKIHSIVNHEHDLITAKLDRLQEEVGVLKQNNATLIEHAKGIEIASNIATAVDKQARIDNEKRDKI